MRFRAPSRLGDDLPTVDLRRVIIDEANSQGVPEGIALAVAMRESGIMQWRPDGSLIRGAAGEIGIFQLMPSTAAQLGIDPEDPLQNIHGGIKYLAQMFAQFGSWPLAIAAYNWGPAKVSRQLAAGKTVCDLPISVRNYVSFVMGSGTLAQCAISFFQAAAPSAAIPAGSPAGSADVPSSGLSPGAAIATATVGVFGIIWALVD